MPTKRLSTYEKENLVYKFRDIIYKCSNSQHFPVKKNELVEWTRSLLPESVVVAFDVMMDYSKQLEASPTLARTAYSDVTFQLETDDATYKGEFNAWNVEGDILACIYTIKEGDMYFDEMVRWAEERRKTQHKIKDAIHYIEQLIHACTSAGQVKLLLPDEVDKFLPSSLLHSLQWAERKSRVPRHWNENKEREQVFMEMLALGSLSPKEYDEETYPSADVIRIHWKNPPKGS